MHLRVALGDLELEVAFPHGAKCRFARTHCVCIDIRLSLRTSITVTHSSQLSLPASPDQNQHEDHPCATCMPSASWQQNSRDSGNSVIAAWIIQDDHFAKPVANEQRHQQGVSLSQAFVSIA